MAGWPPKKNAAFTFYCGLPDMSALPNLRSNPTLAAGDVVVEIDGVANGNIGTLPVVTPAGTRSVKVVMTASEMNGDNIVVKFIDQTSPKEWSDVMIVIQTSTNQIDDLATSLASHVASWTAALATALSTGLSTIGTNLDARVSTRSSHSAADAATAVLAAIVTGATSVQTVLTKIVNWVIGTDNKVLLSTDAQSGVTIPTVTSVGTVSALADNAITAAKIATGAIDADALAADINTYQAKVDMLDDNTSARDRYFVSWFKNGQPVMAGIVNPTIQVIKASDGSDLIAPTALTQIVGTACYQYAATIPNRISDGAVYLAQVTATIDGGLRTWIQPIGRDS